MCIFWYNAPGRLPTCCLTVVWLLLFCATRNYNITTQKLCCSIMDTVYGNQIYHTSMTHYPLVIQHSYETSPLLIGKSTISGPFSTAMLNYQRVQTIFHRVDSPPFANHVLQPETLCRSCRRCWWSCHRPSSLTWKVTHMESSWMIPSTLVSHRISVLLPGIVDLSTGW